MSLQPFSFDVVYTLRSVQAQMHIDFHSTIACAYHRDLTESEKDRDLVFSHSINLKDSLKIFNELNIANT